MKTNFMISFLFAVAAVIFQWNCKHNPVEPPAHNSRDYNWTVETISYPGSGQTMMMDLYAADAKNIWVVGHNAASMGQMYYYDGHGWTLVKLSFGSMDLAAVTGFNKDNVWAVGVKWPQGSPQVGLIIHYDGKNWIEMSPEGINTLVSVWGNGPNDVWFGGLAGSLLHFDGSSIRPDSVPHAIPPDGGWGFYAGAGKSNDDAYAVLVGEPLTNHVAWSYTFNRRSGTWVFIDSSNGYINSLWYSPWGKLYRTGAGIGYWSPLGWNYLNLYGFTRGIYGVSDDNLFAVGSSVWHWNGVDWYEFTNLPSVSFSKYKVWTDGREAFVVGTDGSNTYVLHGR